MLICADILASSDSVRPVRSSSPFSANRSFAGISFTVIGVY